MTIYLLKREYEYKNSNANCKHGKKMVIIVDAVGSEECF
jgi:hypothetical protein